eukprot:SAG31_NODE_92_length_26360_cov_29.601881_11_plen_172_part_00
MILNGHSFFNSNSFVARHMVDLAVRDSCVFAIGPALVLVRERFTLKLPPVHAKRFQDMQVVLIFQVWVVHSAGSRFVMLDVPTVDKYSGSEAKLKFGSIILTRQIDEPNRFEETIFARFEAPQSHRNFSFDALAPSLRSPVVPGLVWPRSCPTSTCAHLPISYRLTINLIL